MMSYWEEAVELSLEEAGVVATAKQIKAVAEDMGYAEDTHGMATGNDVADANLSAERGSQLASLRRELREEREKVRCTVCLGRGSITSGGVYPIAVKCKKCDGEGRL